MRTRAQDVRVVSLEVSSHSQYSLERGKGTPLAPGPDLLTPCTYSRWFLHSPTRSYHPLHIHCESSTSLGSIRLPTQKYSTKGLCYPVQLRSNVGPRPSLAMLSVPNMRLVG